ncbi:MULTISPECIES: DUF4376 domain-containing protein [Halomonas]|uniref:DUF4376 domain-containing protein n=1 Tax=Halomonas halophila TaxID=29573 RepID=A0ABQ0U932_9GAMM|nr:MULTISPECIES: DUF4376 domain-containing protein [Halomonas]MDR5891076.1 DUF4376 domain-containing protein [Halomonas salina]WJY08430.1 DUF4376 domain-containing protein [Halomonas halophila]GEK74233.1 hypothetical protein HHA04nite_27770 [Halomonas halophila]
MRIYDINPTNGTVIDPAGREAPIDPMRREPRIPAGATGVEPPANGANEAARWAGEAWEVVADWRGHVYWLTDGSRHEISELGIEPPADALDQAPPEPLEDLAERKRAAIATALADALAAGMPYTMPDGSEDTVQMLAEDRQNLLGLAIEARNLKAAGVSDPVQEFRGLSNTRYPMTPDQVIALTDAALGHYKVLKARSWDRKDAIDAALAAEDREGIEAVVW